MLTSKALNQLSVHLDYHTALRERLELYARNPEYRGPSACPVSAGLPPSPDDAEQRILEHCLVYAQTYAAIEDFVTRRLSESLSIISKSSSRLSIYQSWFSVFRENCALVLKDIDKKRYAHFDPKEIVSNLGDMLSDTRREINSSIALMSFENHRLSEISRLYELCGIESLTPRLDSDERFTDFFQSSTAEDNTVDGYLTRIVRERNSAAHTLVETITSSSLQQETIRFASVLIDCLDDYIYFRELQVRRLGGMLNELGSVSKVFKSGRIAILELSGALNLNDRILLVRGDREFLVTVSSIQVDDVNVYWVQFSRRKEIGLMGAKFQVGDIMFRPAD